MSKKILQIALIGICYAPKQIHVNPTTNPRIQAAQPAARIETSKEEALHAFIDAALASEGMVSSIHEKVIIEFQNSSDEVLFDELVKALETRIEDIKRLFYRLKAIKLELFTILPITIKALLQVSNSMENGLLFQSDLFTEPSHDLNRQFLLQSIVFILERHKGSPDSSFKEKTVDIAIQGLNAFHLLIKPLVKEKNDYEKLAEAAYGSANSIISNVAFQNYLDYIAESSYPPSFCMDLAQKASSLFLKSWEKIAIEKAFEVAVGPPKSYENRVLKAPKTERETYTREDLDAEFDSATNIDDYERIARLAHEIGYDDLINRALHEAFSLKKRNNNCFSYLGIADEAIKMGDFASARRALEHAFELAEDYKDYASILERAKKIGYRAIIWKSLEKALTLAKYSYQYENIIKLAHKIGYEELINIALQKAFDSMGFASIDLAEMACEARNQDFFNRALEEEFELNHSQFKMYKGICNCPTVIKMAHKIGNEEWKNRAIETAFAVANDSASYVQIAKATSSIGDIPSTKLALKKATDLGIYYYHCIDVVSSALRIGDIGIAMRAFEILKGFDHIKNKDEDIKIISSQIRCYINSIAGITNRALMGSVQAYMSDPNDRTALKRATYHKPSSTPLSRRQIIFNFLDDLSRGCYERVEPAQFIIDLAEQAEQINQKFSIDSEHIAYYELIETIRKKGTKARDIFDLSYTYPLFEILTLSPIITLAILDIANSNQDNSPYNQDVSILIEIIKAMIKIKETAAKPMIKEKAIEFGTKALQKLYNNAQQSDQLAKIAEVAHRIGNEEIRDQALRKAYDMAIGSPNYGVIAEVAHKIGNIKIRNQALEQGMNKACSNSDYIRMVQAAHDTGDIQIRDQALRKAYSYSEDSGDYAVIAELAHQTGHVELQNMALQKGLQTAYIHWYCIRIAQVAHEIGDEKITQDALYKGSELARDSNEYLDISKAAHRMGNRIIGNIALQIAFGKATLSSTCIDVTYEAHKMNKKQLTIAALQKAKRLAKTSEEKESLHKTVEELDISFDPSPAAAQE